MDNIRVWIEERFLDFRRGHGVYLAFFLGFINFITLNYALLISKSRFLSALIPDFVFFTVLFMTVYPTTAILVGYFLYRKRQLKTELSVNIKENPFMFKAIHGKETQINLPFARLQIIFWLKLMAQEGILDDEDESEAMKLIDRIDHLLKGKSLDP